MPGEFHYSCYNLWTLASKRFPLYSLQVNVYRFVPPICSTHQLPLQQSFLSVMTRYGWNLFVMIMLYWYLLPCISMVTVTVISTTLMMTWTCMTYSRKCKQRCDIVRLPVIQWLIQIRGVSKMSIDLLPSC